MKKSTKKVHEKQGEKIGSEWSVQPVFLSAHHVLEDASWPVEAE